MTGQRYDKGFETFKAEGYNAAVGDVAVRGMDREPAKLLNEVGDKIAANSTAIVTETAADGQRAVIVSLMLMAGVLGVGIAGAGVFGGVLFSARRHPPDRSSC